jgi:class 3 adenylate cyclase
VICSVCGTRNPDNARFCLQCGNPLTGRAEGERRIVTMLFCDVVGSTAMAERLDPEAWAEIMNQVFELEGDHWATLSQRPDVRSVLG